MDLIETAIPGRDLEALTVKTHRAVGAALLALDLDTERGAQLLAAGTLAPDVGTREVALHRCGAELTMHGAVIVLDHPRLGRHVQLLKREIGFPFEHRKEASLDATPDIFLLAIDVWRVWERGQVQNAEVMKPGGELPGDHRRASIGHQRTREPHLLQRLAQAVDQLFGALVGVPLGMAQEPRAVIDEADQERLDVRAAPGQDLARAVMEVQMHQLQHVLDLVATDLALFEPIAGGDRAVGSALRRTSAQ